MSLIKVELHTHTNYSYDSFLNKYFYLIMLKFKKINVVAITDHNEILGAIKFKDFLEKYNIRVIIGEEINTQNGEIIGLFLKKKIEPGLSVSDTINQIKKQNGIVYIPHPYDEKRIKTVLNERFIKENKHNIDLIEIYNGRNILEKFSLEQERIAKENEIQGVVGSDAHFFLELGRNYNLIEDFYDKKEFLNNIKNIRYIKKENMKLSHQITRGVKIIKLLKKGELSGLYRIIKGKCSRRG